MSLRKSERATTTPDQVTLTPEEHADLGEETLQRGVGQGQNHAAFIAANTNLAAAAAQIKSKTAQIEKGATFLMKGLPASAQPTPSAMAAAPSQLKLPPIATTRWRFCCWPPFPSPTTTLRRSRPTAPRPSRLHSCDGQSGSLAAFPGGKSDRRRAQRRQPGLFAVQVSPTVGEAAPRCPIHRSLFPIKWLDKIRRRAYSADGWEIQTSTPCI